MKNNSFDKYKELYQAGIDHVAVRMGADMAHPHPLSEQMTLSDFAMACGARRVTAHMSSAVLHDQGVRALGLTSADFSEGLAAGAQVAIHKAYTAQGDHLAFCSQVTARNFKPLDVPVVDATIGLEALVENLEISAATARIERAGASQVMLRTYAKILLLSRVAVINNDLTRFVSDTSSMGAAVARIEGRLVAQALEQNSNLSDGYPVFDLASDVSGNVTASAFSEGAFGAAAAKLRTQPAASGDLLNLPVKHLVVAGDVEMAARKVVKDLDLSIQVSVLIDLPAGRWYAMGDPTLHPAVAVLRLPGIKFPVAVKGTNVNQGRLSGFDGSAVRVVADLGAAMLGRTGIVRGGPNT